MACSTKDVLPSDKTPLYSFFLPFLSPLPPPFPSFCCELCIQRKLHLNLASVLFLLFASSAPNPSNPVPKKLFILFLPYQNMQKIFSEAFGKYFGGQLFFWGPRDEWYTEILKMDLFQYPRAVDTFYYYFLFADMKVLSLLEQEKDRNNNSRMALANTGKFFF